MVWLKDRLEVYLNKQPTVQRIRLGERFTAHTDLCKASDQGEQSITHLKWEALIEIDRTD